MNIIGGKILSDGAMSEPGGTVVHRVRIYAILGGRYLRIGFGDDETSFCRDHHSSGSGIGASGGFDGRKERFGDTCGALDTRTIVPGLVAVGGTILNPVSYRIVSNMTWSENKPEYLFVHSGSRCSRREAVLSIRLL